MKRIAFLGPAGTVSEEAARYFFGAETPDFVPCYPISEVFLSTVNGATDASVIPIENTIDGSVSLHVDWLVHEVNLPIQAEWIYPSVQNLIGSPKLRKADGTVDYRAVTKVISIAVAAAQCRTFLSEHLPGVQYEYVSSTAEGVRLVSEHPNEGWAAVGTKLASEIYALHLLAENITDHDNNFTRFILVGNKPTTLKASGSIKTTVLITLPEDYPGALHQVLSAFAWRRVNLSKIESRPTKLRLGSYYFYMDIEDSMDSVLLQGAVAEIEAIGCQVRVLGSYPSYSYETHIAEV